MPRPKRTKIVPSKPTTHLRKTESKRFIKNNISDVKMPFNDLYDVSDWEDGSEQIISGKTRCADKGKSYNVVRSTQELLGEKERAQPFKEKETKRRVLRASKRRKFDLDIASSPDSSAVEIGRKEQSALKESSVFAIEDAIGIHHSPADSKSSDIYINNETKVKVYENGKKDSAVDMRSPLRRKRQTKIAQPLSSSPPPSGIPHTNDKEEGFSFDASTPVNLSDTRDMAASLSTSSSQSKKRKHSELLLPRSSYEASSPILSGMNEIIPATNPDNENSDMNIETEENLLPSLKKSDLSLQTLNDIMAPPHSSSSIQLSPIVHSRSKMNSRKSRILRARTPHMSAEIDSDISSTPSLTHSPDISSDSNTIFKPKKKVIPPSNLSTAQLKALLPKRRRNKTREIFNDESSDHEINFSGLNSDEDELAHVAVTMKPVNPNFKGPNVASKQTSTTPKNRKFKSHNSPNTLRTYSTRTNIHSDDVNEMDSDSGMVPQPEVKKIGLVTQKIVEKIGRDIKRATQKFKEVDMWQLDFEDATASSSSPSDAR